MNHRNNAKSNKRKRPREYQRLISLGKVSANIISELYNPIDATNRFINLALQTIDEDSRNRQFLLESKSGLRQMSALLDRLNNYTKRMEEEFYAIFQKYSRNPDIAD